MTVPTETTSALAEALAPLGYQLGSPDPGLPEALGGPLVNLIGAEATETAAVVAVLDRPAANVDAILQSIAGALSRVKPQLVLRPGEPAPGLGDLMATISAPSVVLPVLESCTVVGALIVVSDRRAGSGGRAPAVGETTGAAGFDDVGFHLSRLRDVQLEVTVELGRTSMIVSDVLGLEIGSVIELDRAAGAPIDVRVNGTLLARGEVVVVDDEYAIRLTEMIDPERG